MRDAAAADPAVQQLLQDDDQRRYSTQQTLVDLVIGEDSLRAGCDRDHAAATFCDGQQPLLPAPRPAPGLEPSRLAAMAHQRPRPRIVRLLKGRSLIWIIQEPRHDTYPVTRREDRDKLPHRPLHPCPTAVAGQLREQRASFSERAPGGAGVEQLVLNLGEARGLCLVLAPALERRKVTRNSRSLSKSRWVSRGIVTFPACHDIVVQVIRQGFLFCSGGHYIAKRRYLPRGRRWCLTRPASSGPAGPPAMMSSRPRESGGSGEAPHRGARHAGPAAAPG